MKKMIFKFAFALMHISTIGSAAAAASHDCSHPPKDILEAAKHHVPAKLKNSDAIMLLAIAEEMAVEKHTSGGIKMPAGKNEREAFLIAGWLVNQLNTRAAQEVISATKNSDRTMFLVEEGLKKTNSPMSDNGDEEGSLGHELGVLHRKTQAAREAVGDFIKEPGVDLFIRAVIYMEPISEKIALDLMCRSSDKEVFKKAERLRVNLTSTR